MTKCFHFRASCVAAVALVSLCIVGDLQQKHDCDSASGHKETCNGMSLTSSVHAEGCCAQEHWNSRHSNV